MQISLCPVRSFRRKLFSQFTRFILGHEIQTVVCRNFAILPRGNEQCHGCHKRFFSWIHIFGCIFFVHGNLHRHRCNDWEIQLPDCDVYLTLFIYLPYIPTIYTVYIPTICLRTITNNRSHKRTKSRTRFVVHIGTHAHLSGRHIQWIRILFLYDICSTVFPDFIISMG